MSETPRSPPRLKNTKLPRSAKPGPAFGSGDRRLEGSDPSDDQIIDLPPREFLVPRLGELVSGLPHKPVEVILIGFIKVSGLGFFPYRLALFNIRVVRSPEGREATFLNGGLWPFHFIGVHPLPQLWRRGERSLIEKNGKMKSAYLWMNSPRFHSSLSGYESR
jgi:hypothetical protein